MGVLLAVDDGEAMSDRAERTVRAISEHPLLDATWSRYEPGERGPDPHVHHRHTDAFYIAEGEITFGLGQELGEVRAPAGTFVLVPANVIHTFGNEGDVTARYLNLHAPSTGFVANLRSGGGFDSHDAPATGGGSAADAIVIPPGGGEHLPRATGSTVVLAETDDLSFIELVVAPGFTVDPHTHDAEVDAFLVLEGELVFTVGERELVGPAGTWVAAPPGARHGFRNAGPAPARLLNTHAPETGFVARIRR